MEPSEQFSELVSGLGDVQAAGEGALNSHKNYLHNLMHKRSAEAADWSVEHNNSQDPSWKSIAQTAWHRSVDDFDEAHRQLQKIHKTGNIIHSSEDSGIHGCSLCGLQFYHLGDV